MFWEKVELSKGIQQARDYIGRKKISIDGGLGGWACQKSPCFPSK